MARVYGWAEASMLGKAKSEKRKAKMRSGQAGKAESEKRKVKSENA
jgi:hypothetical protein